MGFNQDQHPFAEVASKIGAGSGGMGGSTQRMASSSTTGSFAEQMPRRHPDYDVPPPVGVVDRFMLGARQVVNQPGGMMVLTGAAAFALFSIFIVVIFFVSDSGQPGGTPKGEINFIINVTTFALVFMAAMGMFVAYIRPSWAADYGPNREQSRLARKVIRQFLIVAAVPIILLSPFAFLSFTSLDTWFSDKTTRILTTSEGLVASYLAEHRTLVLSNILTLAQNLNDAVDLYRNAPEDFNRFLSAQAKLQELLAAYVIDSQNTVLAQANDQGPVGDLEPLTVNQFEQAARRAIVNTSLDSNQIVALFRLKAFEDAYLLIARGVDPRAQEMVTQLEKAAKDYRSANENRSNFQTLIVLFFAGMGTSVLIGTLFYGIVEASRLAKPLSELALAANQISSGDLAARVRVLPGDDEIVTLGHTFNQMSADLQHQRDELVEANRQSEHRRGVMEAVLSGVTAGVIGMDWRGTVTLTNKSAGTLLGVSENDLMGQDIRTTVPELAAVLRMATMTDDPLIESDVSLIVDGQKRNLLVRVASEGAVDEESGYVVTFDDITDLVSAQRTAAWADIARRIAHEIKNPLTPIQLSAERLRRKYLKEIHSQPEVFEQCTETIIRQVGDIGRMVDEFSSFARMPEAVMKPEDVSELVRQATFLQRVGNPDITFELDLPDDPIQAECDGRQLSQALINILKNASEAVATRLASDDSKVPGRIITRAEMIDGRIDITVVDNGCGLPKNDRHRLTEPYITTREKGTGLGLAIVRKVMEDHGGSVRLTDAPLPPEGEEVARGAMVRLSFPVIRKAGLAPDTIQLPREDFELADALA